MPRALEWARPEGGPSAPAWALAWSLPGSPAAFAPGEAELGMGRRRKGVQVGLQGELIFPAPPSDLSRFGAWPEVSEPGLGFLPKPGAAEAGEDRPCAVGEQTLSLGTGGWCGVSASSQA